MTKYISLAVCAVFIAIDQLIKALAMTGLVQRITVIPGLFYLTYVENRGAAFGIFQGQTTVLATISILVLMALLVTLISGKIKEGVLVWSLALVLAGGVGNCIDRLSRGFVVDYLDFSAILGFPVFNLADCCVVTGTGLILIYTLFLERKKTAAIVPRSEPEKEKKDGDNPEVTQREEI